MTTLGGQISKNVIDAMNTSENLRNEEEERTTKRSHSSRVMTSEEDQEHSRRKHQNLRNNSCINKSQIHEQRNVREEIRSQSSEDEQFFNVQ